MSYHLRSASPVRILTALLAFTQLLISVATSQTNSWIPLNGPNGATVRSIVRDSCSTLYVMTDGGMYRSLDNAATWELLRTPRTYVSNYLFEITPLGCGIVVAHGMYASCRSNDRGSTWQWEDTSRWGYRMDSFGRVYSSSRDGIWISYDTAITWTRLGLPGKTVRRILMPGQGQFFCLVDSSLYRSFDGGVSWDVRGFPQKEITKILMDSRGFLFAQSFGALLRSNDSGKTWKSINPPGNIVSIGDILTCEPTELWAATSNGAYCSTNAGDTWIHKGYEEEWVLSLGIDLHGEVLLGTFEALSRYSRSSGRWTEQNKGLHSLRIYSVALRRKDIVAATGLSRVYFSLDGGNSWMQRYSYKKNYSKGPVISLPSGTFLTFSYDTVLCSTDNGSSWTRTVPRQGSVLSDIASNKTGTTVVSLYSGEVMTSTDEGSHWRSILQKGSLRPMRATTIDNAGRVYALTDSSTLFVSIDASKWEEYSLPRQWGWVEGSLGVDNAGSIYVLSYDGVLRSTDHGRAWNTVSGLSYPGRRIAVDQQGNVFIADFQSVYRLADGADTWENIGGTPNDPGVITTIGSTADGIVYAGTQENGLFRSARQFGTRTPTLPQNFRLAQNYPNPFNPRTFIEYELPKASVVSLSVYNALGQLISTLDHGYREAGKYQVQWEANAPSGIYFYRLLTSGFVETKKMILLK